MIDPAMAQAISRCVDPQPKERYASARELADVLEAMS
jgi:hypothetical protein